MAAPRPPSTPCDRAESERLARADVIRRHRLASLCAYDESHCLPPLGAREVGMLDLYAGATLDSDEIGVTP